ncbi:MAG: FeoA family protein [Ruminococcus sp.]
MQSTKSVRPLCSLAYGDAVIASVYLYGAIRRRLQDLGWIPGTAIRCLQTAGGGDPTAYAVRGGVVALRRRDAKMILVQ